MTLCYFSRLIHKLPNRRVFHQAIQDHIQSGKAAIQVSLIFWLSSGWFCWNSAGASAKHTITALTPLPITLIMMLVSTNPMIKPKTNEAKRPSSCTLSNQSVVLARPYPTAPDKRPTTTLTKKSVLLTRSSAMIASHPRFLKSVKTFFPA
mmetsp:Transcript_38356/g.70844  ORF Transcript_38356/g.70844 Transcript_38356/m.70844 type:complete len:150 (-) Transcript_38356:1227-1676(-)